MAHIDQCLRSCAIYLSDGVQYDSRWSPARLEAFDHWTGTTGVLSGQYERKAQKTHWKSMLHRTFREMPQKNMLEKLTRLVWHPTKKSEQIDAGVSVPLGAAARGTQGKSWPTFRVFQATRGVVCQKIQPKWMISRQFIATPTAGWSPQKVVIVFGNPTQKMAETFRLRIYNKLINCPYGCFRK